MTVRILHGDCRDVLKTLPDASVHCVVTSPPYWGLRDYGVAGQIGMESSYQQFIAEMVGVFREVRRVLRADGTLWLNLGDSYATGGNVGRKDTTPEALARRAEAFGTGTGSGSLVGKGAPKPQAYGLKHKDLCGIPWRVAFALQDDGWYLRQDIIWSKANPMPESVTDRCTKSHEYLFLMSKSARYFFDAEAIKEDSLRAGDLPGGKHCFHEGNADRNGFRGDGGMKGAVPANRNKRSVWEVATHPYAEAHFATFPPALIEPCIRAGTSEKGACSKCGAPWERMMSRGGQCEAYPDRKYDSDDPRFATKRNLGARYQQQLNDNPTRTLGWYPSCNCYGAPELPDYPPRPKEKERLPQWFAACAVIDAKIAEMCAAVAHLPVIPAVVLDPFGGAGTTGLVADREQRNGILIELNPAYAEMGRRRIAGDAPLFSTVVDSIP